MSKKFTFSRIAQVLFHMDDRAQAETTLSANAAAGATSVTLTSAASVADGNTIRIGDGAQCEWNRANGAPVGNVVTLATPLGKAHLSGETARKGISYDLGAPTAEGCSVEINTGSTDVNVADRRTVYAILRDYTSAVISGQWPQFTLPQLAAALGMFLNGTSNRVTGAGTTSSPYQLITDGSEFGENINLGIYLAGKLVDGSDIALDLHGVDMDYTALQATLRRGQLGAIPFKGAASSQLAIATTLPGYTATTTLKPKKGNVFNLPQEFGIVAAAGGGMNTTLTAASAAGATSHTVASSTNGAIGDLVAFSSGDEQEVHRLATVPDATHVTTRTPLHAAQGIGVTAVEQAQTKLGGVTEEGLTIAVGGNLREVPFADEAFKGTIPGQAGVTLSFMLASMTLANWAYALGIPQSAISGGRLFANANLGTGTDIVAAYFRGLNQQGNTVEIFATGCSQDIASVAPRLGTTEVAKLPIALRPVTLQFLQY